MSSRKLEVVITGDATSLERAFGKAERSAGGFGSRLGGLTKAGVIGAAIGGVALLGKTLSDSVGAAQEAEKAQARLESALSSANVSYAQHGDAIQKAIEKTSKLAALDDEELSDSFAKLVRSTGDVGKSMEGMALAADIARARNISLEAATKTVERGLLGNEAAFRKVGVEIEKGTTATEAFEKAQGQFAGAAERYGETAGAAQEKLGVAFENLQERIGQKLLPVLVRLGAKFVEVIEWAERNWPKVEKAIQPLMEKIRGLGDEVQTMWDVMRPILAVAIPAAFKVIGTTLEAVGTAFDMLAKTVSFVVVNILKAIDKFLGGVQAIAEAASKLPFVGDKFDGVAEAVGKARERVRGLQQSIDSLRSKDITITTTLLTVYQERDERLPGGPIGRRASGGPVTAGRPYIVGERGPELFVPGNSGMIIPNGGRSGGGRGWGDGDIVIKIGEDEIARASRRGNARWSRGNGAFA